MLNASKVRRWHPQKQIKQGSAEELLDHFLREIHLQPNAHTEEIHLEPNAHTIQDIFVSIKLPSAKQSSCTAKT